MGAAIDPSTIETLRTGLKGTVHAPGEQGYDEGRRAFNLNAHQEPALVVIAESAADIVAAVHLAREQDLGWGYWPRDTASPHPATAVS